MGIPSQFLTYSELQKVQHLFILRSAVVFVNFFCLKRKRLRLEIRTTQEEQVSVVIKELLTKQELQPFFFFFAYVYEYLLTGDHVHTYWPEEGRESVVAFTVIVSPL